MTSPVFPNLNIGVLGGGQLGRMLLQAGIPLGVHLHFLDPDPQASCAFVRSCVLGSFKDYDTVLAFGQGKDIVTVEIEHVNTDALEALQAQGVAIRPGVQLLRTVQDKGLQKLFYQKENIPTAGFELVENGLETAHALTAYPAVLKLRTGGYDGKGVLIVRKAEDVATADPQLWASPCVLEEAVDVAMELAVLVARNPQGQVVAYPPVEMVFHPTANLVEFLLAPARISPALAKEAANIALHLADSLNLEGLLAVEFLVGTDGRLLVNEIAPRPHNSGHHTIDACTTSQYQQHLRAITGMPLGSPRQHSAAAMVNLLGAPGYSGTPLYNGLPQALAMAGVHLHLYGKAETRPWRKMGHMTITAETATEVLDKGRQVQQLITITA